METPNWGKEPLSLHRSGFSLLESLVAIAFLALATLGVIATFLFSTRLNTKSEEQHQAAIVALDCMEEARSLLTKDLQTDVSKPRAPLAELANFELERTQSWVGSSAGLSDMALKQVQVKVFWGSRDNPSIYILEERFMERQP